MTALPHDLIAEIEPGGESELLGRVAVDGDTAARLEALAKRVARSFTPTTARPDFERRPNEQPDWRPAQAEEDSCA